ncbi:capping protein inhibiting regulator of actin dynamics-like [Corticium candelabrum]|uniref:capping protein inhibiting regulator of actin dynamics-like n=1 Tax=Corticium candelabrum TaxID=121492 RepID=UPI002E25C1F8|nr:capping protein inhibiting regulator of actin dynamics-like [Corticium candelabrum]
MHFVAYRLKKNQNKTEERKKRNADREIERNMRMTLEQAAKQREEADIKREERMRMMLEQARREQREETKREMEEKMTMISKQKTNDPEQGAAEELLGTVAKATGTFVDRTAGTAVKKVVSKCSVI